VRRYSFQRSYGTAELFKCMFPDSDIASDFSLDATKTSYLTGYGLSQFFHKETVSSVLNLIRQLQIQKRSS
jgi:hypothetical protein